MNSKEPTIKFASKDSRLKSLESLCKNYLCEKPRYYQQIKYSKDGKLFDSLAEMEPFNFEDIGNRYAFILSKFPNNMKRDFLNTPCKSLTQLTGESFCVNPQLIFEEKNIVQSETTEALLASIVNDDVENFKLFQPDIILHLKSKFNLNLPIVKNDIFLMDLESTENLTAEDAVPFLLNLNLLKLSILLQAKLIFPLLLKIYLKLFYKGKYEALILDLKKDVSFGAFWKNGNRPKFIKMKKKTNNNLLKSWFLKRFRKGEAYRFDSYVNPGFSYLDLLDEYQYATLLDNFCFNHYTFLLMLRNDRRYMSCFIFYLMKYDQEKIKYILFNACHFLPKMGLKNFHYMFTAHILVNCHNFRNKFSDTTWYLILKFFEDMHEKNCLRDLLDCSSVPTRIKYKYFKRELQIIQNSNLSHLDRFF